MDVLIQRSLKKWALLLIVALLAYGAGWLVGTRQANLQNPIRATIEAGENAGAGK